MAEPVMCPECGWTGTQADLNQSESVQQCPVCDTNVEYIE